MSFFSRGVSAGKGYLALFIGALAKDDLKMGFIFTGFFALYSLIGESLKLIFPYYSIILESISYILILITGIIYVKIKKINFAYLNNLKK